MSEVHVEEHSSPIRTPKQLVIVVLLAFLVPTRSQTAIPYSMSPDAMGNRSRDAHGYDNLRRRHDPNPDSITTGKGNRRATERARALFSRASIQNDRSVCIGLASFRRDDPALPPLPLHSHDPYWAVTVAARPAGG